MKFPLFPRHRRLRQNSQIRALVRETALSVDDLMAPLFIVPGEGVRKPIASLPGQFHLSADCVAEEVFALQKLGVKAVLLFGIPEHKDALGSAASEENGVVQRATRAIKQDVKGVLITADLCFCEYTDHGHCGVVVGEDVDNDRTLVELQKQAVSLAQSGVDMVAPSGMIDGMVSSIRAALDEAKFQNTLIMSYSAKYASAYYGPFRDAVDSTPSFGDRKTLQMDPANVAEALKEVEADIAQGADIVMVKPALPYLDVICKIKERYPVPLAAYNVSGEYAMIKAAADRGWIDGERVMIETLQSIKRAGADIIISYFSKEIAPLL